MRHMGWYLAIVVLCVVAVHIFHLQPLRRRDWRFLAIGLTFVTWLLAGFVSLRSTSQATATASLDAYRSWTVLTPAPVPVSRDLAVQCAPVTAAQIEKTRQRDGPHTYRWVRIYANAAALTALRDPRVTVLPAGAMIAKEKLVGPDDNKAEAVAFMIKHAKGQFDGSDGWEFVYRPVGTKPTYEGCVACHRAGGKDYVFWRTTEPR